VLRGGEQAGQHITNAQLWVSWGVALVELKQFEEAAEKFQKAGEIDTATQDLPNSEHT